MTLCVSKQGDNSDGASWAKAFHTIQAALSAVPDEEGGHLILVRPDTYPESDLHPKHKGAPGAYNVLEVDFDGRYGSGAAGYAILDASDPHGGLATFRNNFLQSAATAGEAWDRSDHPSSFEQHPGDASRWAEVSPLSAPLDRGTDVRVARVLSAADRSL